MNPISIESKWMRILIVFCWTVVATILGFGTIDGIALGLGGIENNNIWAMSFGLGTIISYFGLIGAWVRVRNTYALMPVRKINLVRVFLMLGLFAALLLLVGVIGMLGSSSLYFTVSSMFIIVGGVVILLATPKRNVLL